jgi:hypothetical protein
MGHWGRREKLHMILRDLITKMVKEKFYISIFVLYYDVWSYTNWKCIVEL